MPFKRAASIDIIATFTGPQYIRPYFFRTSRMLRKLRFISDSFKYRDIGDRHRDRQDWPMAAKAYYRYLNSRPDDAGIWVQLGHVLKENGELAVAEEAYRCSISIAPEQFDARVHLGHLFKTQGKFEQALEAFREAERAGAESIGHEIDLMVKLINDLLPKTGDEFIEMTYTTLLGHSPDEQDRKHHLERLRAGDGKEAAILSIAGLSPTKALPESESGPGNLVLRATHGDGSQSYVNELQRLRRSINRLDFNFGEMLARTHAQTDQLQRQLDMVDQEALSPSGDAQSIKSAPLPNVHHVNAVGMGPYAKQILNRMQAFNNDWGRG